MNLSGDILRCIKASGLGAGRRVGIWRLGLVRETTIVVYAFGMSGSWKYKLAHCVILSDRPRNWHQCELEFAGIHAEIQVVGTGGLVNAGGPF